MSITSMFSKSVIPEHYDISLQLNSINWTKINSCEGEFRGSLTARVKVLKATQIVAVNTKNVRISDVTFGAIDSDKKVRAGVWYNTPKEIAFFKFSDQLEKTEAGYLCMQFRGFLESSFCQKYWVSEDKVGIFFNATKIHHLFPCWNEPSFKSQFHLAISLDNSYKVLSTGAIQFQRSLENETDHIIFKTTPRMSSSSLGLVLHNFRNLEKQVENVKLIYHYSKNSSSEIGEHILNHVADYLKKFNEYFQVSYPLEKLDIIDAGDLANHGLISLSLDPDLFSDNKILYNHLLSREIRYKLSQQWFGHVVTPKLQSDQWIFDGVAEFFRTTSKDFTKDEDEHLIVKHKIRLLNQAQEIDGLLNSQPISSCKNADFCRIKTSFLLSMLEKWLEQGKFQESLVSFLKKYQSGNANTDDLWKCFEEVSGEGIRDIMSTWTLQAGYPVIRVSEKTEDGRRILIMSQQRFTFNGLTDNKLWAVPFNLISTDEPGVVYRKVLMEPEKQMQFVLDDVPEDYGVMVEAGFYHVAYTSGGTLQSVLIAIQDQINPPFERFSMLNDLFNFVQAGITTTADLFHLLKCYENEDNLAVWNAVTKCMGKLDAMLCHQAIYEKFVTYKQNLLEKTFSKINVDQMNRYFDFPVVRRKAVNGLKLDTFPENSNDWPFRHYQAGVKLNTEKITDIFNDYIKTESKWKKWVIFGSLGLVEDRSLVKKVVELSMNPEINLKEATNLYQILALDSEKRDIMWEYFHEFHPQPGFTEKWNVLMNILIMNFWTEDKISELDSERFCVKFVDIVKRNADWLKRDIGSIETFLTEYLKTIISLQSFDDLVL